MHLLGILRAIAETMPVIPREAEERPRNPRNVSKHNSSPQQDLICLVTEIPPSAQCASLGMTHSGIILNSGKRDASLHIVSLNMTNKSGMSSCAQLGEGSRSTAWTVPRRRLPESKRGCASAPPRLLLRYRYQTLGPAALTSSGLSASNFLKLSTKREASWRYFSM